MNSNQIILKNPGFITCISFEKSDSFSYETVLDYLKDYFKTDIKSLDEINYNTNLKLKIKVLNEIDYISVEFYFLSISNDFEISNWDLISEIKKIDLTKIFQKEKIFCNKDYVICSNYLELDFAESLLYEVYFKKIDSTRYIYSSKENNEFVVNFLKHIIKFDVYYSKILYFYKKFSNLYVEIQKNNEELIAEYSNIINSKKIVYNENLFNLNKKINQIQAINFGILYDIESIETNLENLKSRLKTIGAEENRYFLNHIEKGNFVIEALKSTYDKNNLIKTNVLDNYVNFTKNHIEQEKLKNENSKINHLRNIKQILSGLTFVEIFINGLAQSTTIFNFGEFLNKLFSSTNFMRMLLILIFVFGYFIWYLYGIIRNLKTKKLNN